MKESGLFVSSRADLKQMSVKINLETTLLALLECDGIEDISVRRIVEGAAAGKSTFYKYYQDKYSLLISAYERFVYGLPAGATLSAVYSNADEFLLGTLKNYIRYSAATVNAFKSDDVRSLRAYHNASFSELVARQYLGVPLSVADPVSAEVISRYAQTVSSAIRDWLSDDPREEGLPSLSGLIKQLLPVRLYIAEEAQTK